MWDKKRERLCFAARGGNDDDDEKKNRRKKKDLTTGCLLKSRGEDAPAKKSSRARVVGVCVCAILWGLKGKKIDALLLGAAALAAAVCCFIFLVACGVVFCAVVR